MPENSETRARIGSQDLLEGRRRDLIRCAAGLFVGRGFAQTTMDEIAAAMGISKPSLYNYIGSKEDIIFITMDYVRGAIGDGMRAAAAELPSVGAAGALRQSIRTFVELADELQDEFLFLNHAITRLDRTGRRRLLGDSASAGEYFERLLSRGIEAGEFSVANTKTMGQMVARICTTWAHDRWFLRPLVTRDEFIEQITSFILAGVSANST
jgi:AcrR family transcriptional regulator